MLSLTKLSCCFLAWLFRVDVLSYTPLVQDDHPHCQPPSSCSKSYKNYLLLQGTEDDWFKIFKC